MMRKPGMLAFLAVLAVSTFSQGAPGNPSDVVITPKRLVFEGRTRMAEVSLANQSDKRITYDISFMHLRMNANGSLQEIKDADPGAQFADGLLRFTPRRVVLEPRQTQSVRFQLRKPEGLADGEYRSNVVFRVVPSTKEPEAGKADELAISLVPVYGISIPVFVRQGKVSVKASISEIAVNAEAEKAPRMSFQIDRDGGKSVYGNIRVELLRKARAPLDVGKLNGAAVYLPLATRPRSIPLDLPKGLQLRGATLRVRFVDAEDEMNQDPAVLATAQVVLP